MNYNAKTLSDFHLSSALEWIETNGLGGYASSTVSGANSRRYHGLLVAACSPPVGRTVLLSKLDETIVLPPKDKGGVESRFELGANQYPGAIHPAGFRFLEGFSRDMFPEFHFAVGHVKIKKTVAAVHSENTTLILYEVTDARVPFTMELLPLSSARDFHSLSHANDNIGRQFLFDKGIFRTLNYQGGAELFISVPKSEFTEQQGWYYNLEYAAEQQRGLDFKEDLYTHGKFSVKLSKGDTLGIIISTKHPQGRNAFRLFDAEKKRREKFIRDFTWNEHVKRLVLAADQFIVKRGTLHTVIAGYHWFADWGRDTMIALEGLCLVTGRFKEAKQILQQFASSVSEGMLPNRFSDYGEPPEYNTIDATLWFFHAVHRYFVYTNDKAFIKGVLPALIEIVDWHIKGTRYNIKVDEADGLLSGGQEGIQLTWMDAKVGDWVVTPRRGKSVEINALWYNALCTLNALHISLGKPAAAKQYGEKAAVVFSGFNEKFWNEKKGCLYDCIQGEVKNDDIRPNQIFAISLPYRLVTGDRAKKVLETVNKFLLTPKGLKSLGAQHHDYRSVYGGDIWMRDSCYHQGTVWSFLLGPYIDALFYVEGIHAKKTAFRIATTFFKHLDEAGVGTVSEIFDADPPHTSRGCIAQAWGVAEVLRVIVQHDVLNGVDKLATVDKNMLVL